MNYQRLKETGTVPSVRICFLYIVKKRFILSFKKIDILSSAGFCLFLWLLSLNFGKSSSRVFSPYVVTRAFICTKSAVISFDRSSFSFALRPWSGGTRHRLPGAVFCALRRGGSFCWNSRPVGCTGDQDFVSCKSDCACIDFIANTFTHDRTCCAATGVNIVGATGLGV